MVTVQQLHMAHPVGACLERVARGLVWIPFALGAVVLGRDHGPQTQPFAVGHAQVLLEQVLARAIPPRERIIVEPSSVALDDFVLPEAHHHLSRISGDRGNRPCTIDQLGTVALKLPFDTHVLPPYVVQVSQCAVASSSGDAGLTDTELGPKEAAPTFGEDHALERVDRGWFTWRGIELFRFTS